jgi:hypothetical protein
MLLGDRTRRRHRLGSTPLTTLTTQIRDCPMPLALPQAINSQLGYLVTPQSTGEQEGEQRTVAFPFRPLGDLLRGFTIARLLKLAARRFPLRAGKDPRRRPDIFPPLFERYRRYGMAHLYGPN